MTYSTLKAPSPNTMTLVGRASITNSPFTSIASRAETLVGLQQVNNKKKKREGNGIY